MQLQGVIWSIEVTFSELDPFQGYFMYVGIAFPLRETYGKTLEEKTMSYLVDLFWLQITSTQTDSAAVAF
jgi:hypothetical protein